MRPLVIIPLLLLLAVACDSVHEAIESGFNLAVATRVPTPTNTIDDDVPEPVTTTPVAEPTVSDPAPSEDERGVVIDGLCPAEVEPVTVRTRHHPEDTEVWEVRGTAHQGRIVLEWDEHTVPGVTGYIVTRHSSEGRGKVLDGSVRTFAVDAVSNGGAYADSTDIEPRIEYHYRVFPVTVGGIAFPSEPLEIWSIPERSPTAPIKASAGYSNGGWRLRANYPYLKPVNGMRVLRRASGEARWEIVHDEISLPDSHHAHFPGFGSDTWRDEDVNQSTDYEYAVCFGNAAGIGRAVLVDASRVVEPETVGIDPPRGIKVVRFPYYITVHWTPVDDTSVTGYRVERLQVNDDDIHRLHFGTYDRAENYVTMNTYFPNVAESKFRVRSVTREGRGPWSEWVGVNIVDADGDRAELSKPEFVTATATHSLVHLVWRTEDSLDGLDVRYLRRQIGTEDEFTAYDCFDWVSLSEFNWDWTCAGQYASFTDEYDVRPDTEYEYMVQTKRGDFVSPMSDPVSVRTRVNPSVVERRPLPVYDLEALPTSDGVLLTWELPDDPTLKGTLLWETEQDHDVNTRGPPVVLPPDQTSYVALTRGFRPEPYRYWFDLDTFNDYGTQAVGLQRTYASAPDMLHCRATTEEVMHADNAHHLTIRFRACDETSTHVIRRELTADGFEVSEVNRPCTWHPSEVATNYRGFDHFGGTLKCEYDDTSVKPGMWYVYELTQTLEDGRMFKSHHEILTYPRVDGGG